MNKNIVLQSRVSKEEYASYKKEAKACKMKLSAWIRHILNSGAKGSETVSNQSPESYIAVKPVKKPVNRLKGQWEPK